MTLLVQGLLLGVFATCTIAGFYGSLACIVCIFAACISGVLLWGKP